MPFYRPFFNLAIVETEDLDFYLPFALFNMSYVDVYT